MSPPAATLKWCRSVMRSPPILQRWSIGCWRQGGRSWRRRADAVTVLAYPRTNSVVVRAPSEARANLAKHADRKAGPADRAAGQCARGVSEECRGDQAGANPAGGRDVGQFSDQPRQAHPRLPGSSSLSNSASPSGSSSTSGLSSPSSFSSTLFRTTIAVERRSRPDSSRPTRPPTR